MHCELHPSIVYTQFSSVIRNQKEIMKELIEQRQQDVQTIHPGLTCFKEGVRIIPVEAIPGLREAGMCFSVPFRHYIFISKKIYRFC